MARHVIQNQQLLGLYAMEEGRNKGGRPGRIKCHGRPYTAVGGRPWMALGTPKIDYIVGTSGPVREDRVSGCPSGDNLSQETCVPRVWIESFSFWVAVIRLSDSAERHKPAKDRQTRPTISPPSTLSVASSRLTQPLKYTIPSYAP